MLYIIFASTVKHVFRKLMRRKAYLHIFFYLLFSSFLPDVPRFLLLFFPFCFENFLYSLRAWLLVTNHLSFPHLENVLISPFIPIGYFCLDIGFWVFISFLYHLKNTVPLHSDHHDLWGEICCYSFFSFIGEVLFSSGCFQDFFCCCCSLVFRRLTIMCLHVAFIWLYSVWFVQLPESLGLSWNFWNFETFQPLFLWVLFQLFTLVLGLW